MDQPAHVQDQESFTIEDDEITKADFDSDSNTEEEVAVQNYWQSAIFTKNDQLKFHRVEEGSSDFVKLKTCFVNGMRNFDSRIEVIAIHKKNQKWDAMDEARAESFRVFTVAVASKNGGDPNLKYGWYGGSREEITDILCNGFCTFQNTSSSHGHGVYFSPANNPMYSARFSIGDAEGAMHILLCRLILGKSEAVAFGSQMNKPTSTEFDSGVDHILSPTKYIIWEPYMNTTVLPVFIITFKPDPLKAGPRSVSTSRLMWANFMTMHLPNYLSSSKMALIKNQYDQFRQNKISRGIFIRNLRLIAGDHVLREVIQRHGR